MVQCVCVCVCVTVWASFLLTLRALFPYGRAAGKQAICAEVQFTEPRAEQSDRHNRSQQIRRCTWVLVTACFEC